MVRLLHLTLLVTSLCAATAHAQAWKPTRNIEIIVGSAAGGGADLNGRLMQKLMQGELNVGVSSSVVNKTGGGSALSYIYLNQHPGNAHYIALSFQPMITGPMLLASQVSYTDMTPLAHLDRKSTRLNSSHVSESRMPSSA